MLLDGANFNLKARLFKNDHKYSLMLHRMCAVLSRVTHLILKCSGLEMKLTFSHAAHVDSL
jgi:hypothetical protein